MGILETANSKLVHSNSLKYYTKNDFISKLMCMCIMGNHFLSEPEIWQAVQNHLLALHKLNVYVMINV